MELQCPSCGERNPERARFCLGCGQALARVPAGESRKRVTIVFADMVGFTTLGERLDTESLRRVMDRFYVEMRDAIERHGGRVAKFIGDAVMAVWGMPSVSEDDAIRAVRGAGAMRNALKELNVELQERWGVRVGLRTGVNSGEVIVDPQRPAELLVGDTLNVAARLEQAAGDGEVLVGPSTYRLVRGEIALEEIPPLRLKGKSKPMRAWRLLDAAAPPAVRAAHAAPLVGRDEELGALRQAFDEAVRDQRCRIVCVIGSPGVGKSRLASELALMVGERARVVTGRCTASGEGDTFAPVAAALREAAELSDAAPTEVVRERLATVLGTDGERDRIVERVAGVLGIGPVAPPEETFWAVRRTIAGMAARQPLVIVLDDLHWAEPTLVDLVEHLGEWGRDAPVLVLALARPELREQRPRLTEAALALRPLDTEASRSLVDGLLGGEAELPDALADEVLRTTEGNPLFLGETIRMLVDDGVLRREGSRWTAAGGTAEVTVPPTIHALLAARLERLSPDERAVIERASVIGHQFPRGAVAELCAPTVRERLDRHLAALARKELVMPEDVTWQDEPLLRFHHVLIRDAAYRSLLKQSRAELHAQFATWLEDRPGELDELAGFHLEQAHRYRAELGPLDAGGRALGERAAARLHAAGRRALEREDLPAAIALLRRALAAREDGEVLVDLAEAVLSTGDIALAADVVEELSLAASDERLQARATVAAVQLESLLGAGELREAVQALESAAATLARVGDRAGEAKAYHVMASVHALLGQVAAAEAALDRALVAGRAAGDQRRVTAVLSGAPRAALWGPSPIVRASGRCLDVVRILRMTDGTRHVEAVALRCQAVLEAMRGRAGAARRILAGCRAVLEEMGLRYELCELDVHAGLVELLDGDAASAAEAALRAAHDGFHALGADVGAAGAAALLARALLDQGRDAEAEQLTRVAEEHAGEDLKTTIAWLGARARALARRGEHDEALALARRAWALAEPTDALADKADALMALAAVLRDAGDAAAAAQTAEQARELYAHKQHAVGVARAEALAGAAAAAPAPAVVDGDERPAERLPEAKPDGGRPACDVVHEFGELCARAFDARDWDALRSGMAPSFSAHDRRVPAVMDVSDGDALVEHMRAALLVMPDARMESRTLAGVEVPGGHVGAFHVRWRGHQAETGESTEVVYITLTRLEAGLVTYQEYWDPQDAEAALARYDELAAERPLTPFVRRRAADAMRWFNERDWDAYRAALADDYVAHDRRAVSMMEMPGPDTLIDNMKGTLRVVPDAREDCAPIAGAEIPGGHVGAFHARWSGHQIETGDRTEVTYLAVNRFDGDLLAYCELFDGHDREAALAAFDALVDASTVPAAVSERLDGWIERFNARDWDAVAEGFAADAVWIDERSGVNVGVVQGRAAAAAQLRSFVDVIGDVTVRPEPLAHAQFGGDVKLIAWIARARWREAREGTAGPGELSFAFVTLRAGGETVCHYTFDDADHATPLARCEQLRSALSVGFPWWAAIWAVEWVRRIGARDWDALAELYHPAYRLVSHRRLPWEALDGVQAATAHMRSFIDQSPNLETTLTPIAGFGDDHGDGAVLARITLRGTNEAGGEFVVDYYNTGLLRDRRLLLSEHYDDDGAARARLEELQAADAIPAAVRERLESWMDVVNSRGWETVAEGFAEDVIVVDERSGANQGVLHGRAAATAWLRSYVDVIGDMTLRAEPIAGAEFDGDVLVVAWIGHGRWHDARAGTAAPAAGAGELDIGMVSLRAAGEPVYHHLLDPDDRATLLARYERLRTALAAGLPWWAAVWMSEWVRSGNARDWDGMTELHDRDYRLVSHRTLPWETLDRDTAIAAMRSFVNEAPDTEGTLTPIAGFGDARGDGAFVAKATLHGTNEAGGAFVYDWFTTAVMRNRLNLESEHFDDEASARARLEELRAASTIPASVRARLTAAAERFNRREWATQGEVFTDDVLWIDERSGVNAGVVQGREAVVEHLRGFVDVIGEVTIDPEPLAGAEFDGDLLLIAWVAHGNWGRGGAAAPSAGSGRLDLSFVSLIVGGKVALDHVVDGDRTGAVLARYERMRAPLAAGVPWWALLVIERFVHAFNDRDWATVEALSHDGAELIDHRRVGLPALEGAASLAGAPRALVDLAPDARMDVTPLAGYGDGDGAVATRRVVRGTDATGGAFELRYHTVSRFADRRLRVTELFEEEAEALARLEELRSAGSLPPLMARLWERWLGALKARDWAAFAGCYAPEGHRFEDHRRLDGQISGSSSGAESAELWRTRLELAPDLVPSHEVLDVAGARLALGRIRFESQAAAVAGVGPSAIDVLQIVELDATGRIALIHYFDPDDLDAVRATFDALRKAPASVREWARRWTQAFNARDWDAMGEVYADGYRDDDRRPLGWNSHEGIETIVDAMRSGVAMSADMQSEIDVLGGYGDDAGNAVAATARRFYGTNEYGGAIELVWHSVFVLRGGRLAFAVRFEDAAAALARLEELRRERFPPLLMAAWERWRAAFEARDWEALAACYDGRFEDHRRIDGEFAGVRSGTASGAESARVWRERVELAPDSTARLEVLDVAGDRLGLFRVRVASQASPATGAGPSAIEAPQVVELDAAGRPALIHYFDPDDLDSARATFDALRSAPAFARDWARRWERRFNARDWDAMRELYVDDYRFDDRRRISGESYEGVGAAIKATRAAVSVGPDMRVAIDVLRGHGDREGGGAAATTMRFAGTNEYGGAIEFVWHTVFTFHDGRLASTELFDDADAALARLEELRGVSETLGSEHSDDAASALPRLEELRGLQAVAPVAVRDWARRFERRFNARDWGALRELYVDDYRFDDRRLLPWESYEGGDAAIDLMRSAVATCPDLHGEVEVLGGDDAAAAMTLRFDGTNETGGAIEVVWHSAYAFRGGRVASSEFFETPEDALARVEELRAPALPPLVETARRRITQAIAERDWDAVAACYAPEYRFDDRRGIEGQLGSGSGPADAAERWRSRVAVMGEPRLELVPLAVASDHAALMRSSLRLDRPAITGVGPGSIDSLLLCVVDDDARITHVDWFEPDDLAAALAALAEHRAGAGVPAWIAVVFAEYKRAYDARDWEALGLLLHDELAVEDHRPVGLGRVSGPKAFLRLLPPVVAQVPDVRATLTLLEAGEYGRARGIAAVRCLAHGTAATGGPVEIFHCWAIRLEAGRIRSWDVFATEEEATARCAQWRAALDEGVPWWGIDLVERFARTCNDRDWDGFVALFDPAAVIEDRRALGWGTLDAKGFAALVQEGDALADNLGMQVSAVAGFGDGAGTGTLLFRAVARRNWPTGGPLEVVFWGLMRCERGVIVGGAAYNDEAEARRRLDELRAEAATAPGWITRVVKEYQRAYDARDWDSLSALLHDELEFEDHRPVGAGRISGPREFVAQLLPLAAQAPDMRASLELLAAGEHGAGRGIAAVRCLAHGTAATGGPVEVFHCWALRLQDGRIRTWELFATEDEATARCAQWRAALDAGVPWWGLDVAERFGRARNARDWEAFAVVFDAEARIEDHRAFGWGTLDPAGMARLLQAGDDLARITLHVEPIGGCGDDSGTGTILVRLPGTGTLDSGGAFELVIYALMRCVDGLIVAGEVFDDEAAARARLAELRDADLPAAVRYWEVQNARDWDGLATLLADDFVRIDHRPMPQEDVHGREAGVAVLRSYVGIMPDATLHLDAVLGRRPGTVAVRLHGTGTGPHGVVAENVFFVVIQVAAARMTRMDTFASDEEAIAYLDDPERLLHAYTTSYNARDWDTLAQLYAEDYILVDHRPVGWEDRRGRAAHVELLRSWADFSPDSRMRIDRVVERVGDRIAVVAVGSGSHDGIVAETFYGFVWQIRDGRFARIDIFDGEDEAAMRACLSGQMHRAPLEPGSARTWRGNRR